MRKEYLTWSEVEILLERIIGNLTHEYDLILAITRGGIVPAGILAERLDIPHVLTASVQFFSPEGFNFDWPVFLMFPDENLLQGQRVLVVDDLWVGGRTMINVKERVEGAGGFPELAVLHYKPSQSRYPELSPDFYGAITDAWIVYPWELGRAGSGEHLPGPPPSPEPMGTN
ncbi:MAG: phosphoribosyltransferase [Chloroflexi bacterium]|nr:phosphoribosyltransferase [Chloroflexota bacterium]